MFDFNEKMEKWIGKLRPVRATSYNAIFLELQLAGIKCSLDYVKAIVNSSYPREFNPFTDYIEKLKPWDGVTDYIGQLAETVQTEDQEFWKKSFRKWFVPFRSGNIPSTQVATVFVSMCSFPFPALSRV